MSSLNTFIYIQAVHGHLDVCDVSKTSAFKDMPASSEKVIILTGLIWSEKNTFIWIQAVQGHLDVCDESKSSAAMDMNKNPAKVIILSGLIWV